ncbi:MAG: oligosaccharide flippase family protein, partial [Chloroflexi bacterium]|nr:oligosaccharide flippase family protein [Chloroflexota bacterium]
MAEATATHQEQARDSRLIISNSLILIGRRAVLMVFSVVMVLFLPRYLGDEGLGQFAFAQSVGMLFMTVLTLGLGKFLTKEIARNHALIRSHLGTAIGIKVVTALVTVLIIVGVVNLTGYSENADRVLYIAAATAIALSFAMFMGDVLYGLEEMSWPAVAEVGSRLLVIAIGIPVLVMGMGVVAYSLVIFLSALVYFGLNLAYLARRFSVRLSFDPAKIRFLVVGGLPFILMGFLLDIYNQTDTIVLRVFTSDAVVGWYAAANNIYKAIDM